MSQKIKDKDSLLKFLIENRNIRGELVRLNRSYIDIVEQHKYPPAICRLLGEFLAVCVLLNATLKFKGRLTLQFQGESKLKLVLTQCDDQLHIRGLVDWSEDLTEEDFIEELKTGILVVNIAPYDSTQRYQGIVRWKGNSLVNSIEGYFKDSEQLLTKVWVATNESSAAGMLLQALPGQSVDFDEPEPGENWDHIIYLTETLTPQELLEIPHETLLYRLYSQERVRIFESQPILFYCECSQERSENAILMLGQEEAEEELNKSKEIVVTCEFCNKSYRFDRVDIASIFRKGDKGSASQIH